MPGTERQLILGTLRMVPLFGASAFSTLSRLHLALGKIRGEESRREKEGKREIERIDITPRKSPTIYRLCLYTKIYRHSL